METSYVDIPKCRDGEIGIKMLVRQFPSNARPFLLLFLTWILPIDVQKPQPETLSPKPFNPHLNTSTLDPRSECALCSETPRQPQVPTTKCLGRGVEAGFRECLGSGNLFGFYFLGHRVWGLGLMGMGRECLDNAVSARKVLHGGPEAECQIAGALPKA